MSYTEKGHASACGVYFGGTCTCAVGELARAQDREQQICRELSLCSEAAERAEKAEADLARMTGERDGERKTRHEVERWYDEAKAELAVEKERTGKMEAAARPILEWDVDHHEDCAGWQCSSDCCTDCAEVSASACTRRWTHSAPPSEPGNHNQRSRTMNDRDLLREALSHLRLLPGEPGDRRALDDLEIRIEHHLATPEPTPERADRERAARFFCPAGFPPTVLRYVDRGGDVDLNTRVVVSLAAEFAAVRLAERERCAAIVAKAIGSHPRWPTAEEAIELAQKAIRQEPARE